MNQVWTIARKELRAYFGSPLASIFVSAFLLVSLFIVFWIETFFARNIADIRPLFQWLPMLLIFLVASLTMRLWSEEQKMGTVEILFTLPVRLHHLVLGKFLAALLLVAFSLLLTIGLPISVSFMGNLDWGPVMGGYVGALLMSAAYVAIGLYFSSKSDNQIIALLATVFACILLYLVGSRQVVDFFATGTGDVLRGLGSGSRFESIERGVFDIRDFVYYFSLTLFFLGLNILSLDKKRWSRGANTAKYRKNAYLAALLTGLNLFLLNLWLLPLHGLRADLTENNEYSVSQVTKDMITNLQEPLLIRGYFSEKTHPLLAPLIPRIKDLIKEYAIVSGGNITAEFVDPREAEKIEEEANQAYGIKPVPFQIEGRYEASVINSYFDILIKYGDQYKLIGFQDIIEVHMKKDGDIDVKLRNLEYDLTRSIKKVVYGFQSIDSIFESIASDISFKAFITKDRIPKTFHDLPQRIEKVASEFSERSNGKFKFEMIDPDAKGSSINREYLEKEYGLKPLSVSLFSDQTFYLHLLLQVGDEVQRIYPSGEMAEADLKNEIEAALKRCASGFLKTVGLWLPKEEADQQNPYAQFQPPASSYQFVQEKFRENYAIKMVDLTSGRVPGDVDVMLVIAPQRMNEKEQFAIDQYLMRGGSLIIAAGNYSIDKAGLRNGLAIRKLEGGLRDMLKSYGIDVKESMVLDTQNEPFPVPVTRNIGGLRIQEIHQVDYPPFVDIRKDGMAENSPVVSELNSLVMQWVSPIEIDKGKNKEREVVALVTSTDSSWETDKTETQPDFARYPAVGFPEEGAKARHTLAVSVKGAFESYFKDKPSPVFDEEKKDEPTTDNKEKKDAGKKAEEVVMQPIKTSPSSARLAVIGSSEFLNDLVINISRSIGQDRFLAGLEFLENLIDWSVEDEDLLAIRSRGSHARILEPMTRSRQVMWEWINYGVVILSLVIVTAAGIWIRKREKAMKLAESKKIRLHKGDV
ncbi:MAG: Gldg family protein [Pseudomonadota bacterium]